MLEELLVVESVEAEVGGARRVDVVGAVGEEGGISSKFIASTREEEEVEGEEGTGTELSWEEGRVTRRGGRGPRDAE